MPINRRACYLPSVKSKETPNAFICVDTETKPRKQPDGSEKHYLWFGWACYQRKLKSGNWSSPEWFRFETRQEFWNWCYSKARARTRLDIYAHNGAFDLPVLGAFSILPNDGFKMISAVVEAPPMVIKWRKGDRTLRFIDTLNIWAMPLDKLGESIGRNKLEMPAPRASREKWDRYCQQDVEVIRQALLAWWETILADDLGPFATTLASQAFSTYRYRFMPEQLFIDNDERSLTLARESYLGGRTECFRLGKYTGPLYYIDVNSLYPSVMKAHKYPYQIIGTYSRPDQKEIAKCVKKYCCIARVRLKTDLPIYPVVRDGKLIFPVGTFEAVLSHPDFVCAVKRGHVKQVKELSIYKQAYLFKDFVTHFYNARLEARQQGDEVRAMIYKLILNSLYGKFGQRGRRYDETGEADIDTVRVWAELDGETGEVYRHREFGGLHQTFINDDEARYSFPAIAACVTAYGRQVLFEAMERAGLPEVLYCDTDSLVVTEKGWEAMQDLVDPDKLGLWKLEGVLDSVTLNGPKDYIFDGQVKIKGIRRNAEKVGRNKYRQDQFTGFKGLLQNGSLDAPVVRKIVKSLKRKYTKGTVKRSGRVSPFVLRD